MRLLKYFLKRLLTVIPLFIGIIFVIFVIIRLLPGNPAYRLAGAFTFEGTVENLTRRMGLDKPIWQQFLLYIRDVLRGDLGQSWFTNQPVLKDLVMRFPATLELITLSLLLALVIGITLGTLAAVRPKGTGSKISSGYGLMAGALADFWVGLMLVYIFFFRLHWVPAPMGRLNLMTTPPTRYTGSLLVDSLLDWNWVAFGDALSHLVLPVLALGLVFAAPIMKMMRSSLTEVLRSEFITYSRLLGLSNWTVARYAMRNALPPVVTIIGFLYGFLLGGAVLVETVFGWGGLGQYVTMAISNKDYAAIQGFVLFASVFSLIVYLVVDLVYMAIDPRIEF